MFVILFPALMVRNSNSFDKAIRVIFYVLHIHPQIPRVIFILPINEPLDAKGKFEIDRIKIELVFLCIPVHCFTLTNSWVFS